MHIHVPLGSGQLESAVSTPPRQSLRSVAMETRGDQLLMKELRLIATVNSNIFYFIGPPPCPLSSIATHSQLCLSMYTIHVLSTYIECMQQ